MVSGTPFRARLWSTMTVALLVAMPAIGATDDRNLGVAKKTASERQVALVIGNGSYSTAPLRNSTNDARAIAKSLRELGFEVIHRENQSLKGMAQAIREFGNKIKDGGVGVFYYAGHGMQVKGRNYLVPVDADIQSEDEISFNAVDASLVLEKMETARNRMNIMILDACRNNPYARNFRSSATGLAQMDAPSGTLIAFATAPGSVASDGDGSNGIYTQHLLANMGAQGLPVEQMFKRVRIGVMKDTGDKQVPWESSSLKGDFAFRPAAVPQKVATAAAPGAVPAPAIAEVSSATIEVIFWESIKNSQSSADFQAYLDEYPKGKFAALARNRIKTLTAEQKPPQKPATVPAPATPPAGVVAAHVPPAKPVPDVAPATVVALHAPSAGVVGNLAGSTGLPKVGDTWTYRYLDGWKNLPEAKLVYRVLEASAGGVQQTFLFNGRAVDEQTFSAEPRIVERELFTKHGISEFAPYLGAYGLLEEGKSWQGIPYSSTIESSMYGPWKFKARVVGREKVAVPAGTFDAVKVMVTGERSNFASGTNLDVEPRRVLHTLWYSPEIKRIVKQSTLSENFKQSVLDKDTIELVSYKLN